MIEDPNATYDQILGTDKESANRSTYVSTDVRDAIMLMMPGLIRLFAASENPVFIVPRGDDEVDKAQQATDYTNYVFWNDNSGFLILYGALKDALTVRTGYVKWWCDENKETVRKRFTNVTADQVQRLIMENPSAKLVHVGNPVPSGMPRQPPMAPGCRDRPLHRLCRRPRPGLCRLVRHRHPRWTDRGTAAWVCDLRVARCRLASPPIRRPDSWASLWAAARADGGTESAADGAAAAAAGVRRGDRPV